jgi:Flp pilus assembly protein TadG
MVTSLLSCRRGSVSVEAAIIFPVLIALAMGVLEFGTLIFTYSAMQTAAREAARQVAVNFASPDDVEEAVRARLPNWSAEAAEVFVTQSAPTDPATNVFTVLVTMPATDAAPVQCFVGLSDPWDLRAEVAMKQELPL